MSELFGGVKFLFPLLLPRLPCRSPGVGVKALRSAGFVAWSLKGLWVLISAKDPSITVTLVRTAKQAQSESAKLLLVLETSGSAPSDIEKGLEHQIFRQQSDIQNQNLVCPFYRGQVRGRCIRMAMLCYNQNGSKVPEILVYC